MKTIHTTSIALFISLLFSCGHSPQEPASPLTCDIDSISRAAEAPVDSIRDLPLELTDSSLIGSIDKIICLNDKFYIYDQSFHKGVLTFDKNGRFLQVLHPLGQGPGEYLYPVDFDIDSEGNIYIADNERQRILKYEKGNPKAYEEIATGRYFLDFALTEEGNFVLGDVYEQGRLADKLAVYNPRTQTYETLLQPALPEVNEMKILKTVSHYLFKSGRKTYYYHRFTPHVYQPERKEPFATFLSSRYYTAESLKELEGKSAAFLTDTKHIKDINGFYEISQGYVCSILSSYLPDFYYIPRKGNGIQRFGLEREKRLLGNVMLKGVTDRALIFTASYTDANAQKAAGLTGLSADERKIFSQWNADSNPILILVYLKP